MGYAFGAQRARRSVGGIGAVLVLAFMQVNEPEPGQEIYWIAALMAAAIGVVFWQLLKAKDDVCATKDATIAAERARTVRAEAQADQLLRDEAAMKDTIKEQSAIIARAVEVVQQAAAGSLAAAEASKVNTGKLDSILQRLADESVKPKGGSVQ